MKAFWIVVTIIVILIILGGLFIYLFIVFAGWAFGQGIKNKFGPEWIPGELGIRFNYFNVNYENQEEIRYFLSEQETDEIYYQIYSLINDKNQIINDSFSPEYSKPTWIMIDDVTFEFKQIELNKLKATFSTKNKELIYYK